MGRIKVIRAALDMSSQFPVLRGVIVNESLGELQVAPYQREIQPKSTISGIMKGFEDPTQVVPDIFLSCRGMTIEQDATDESTFYIDDPVFTVDGLQRTTAASRVFAKGEISPVVGFEMHFGRDEAWERKMFKTLNLKRKKLSPNIVIRNAAEENPSARILVDLAEHRDFPLKDLIGFDQIMKRTKLLTALTYLKVAGVLHCRFGATRYQNALAIIEGLDRVIATGNENGISGRAFRRNVLMFFTIIRDVWGVSNISKRDTCLHLRETFLKVVATFIVRVDVFWGNNGQFSVAKDVQRKMQQFPIDDNAIQGLTGAGGQAENLLYMHFLQHMNKGRQPKNRFVDRTLLAELGGKVEPVEQEPDVAQACETSGA